jgi:hypothetical protein
MPTITTNRAREQRLRRRAQRLGYVLRKSRTDGSVYQNGIYQGENLDDRGGWLIADLNTNMVVAGERFDLDLDDVERFSWTEGCRMAAVDHPGCSHSRHKPLEIEAPLPGFEPGFPD